MRNQRSILKATGWNEKSKCDHLTSPLALASIAVNITRWKPNVLILGQPIKPTFLSPELTSTYLGRFLWGVSSCSFSCYKTSWQASYLVGDLDSGTPGAKLDQKHGPWTESQMFCSHSNYKFETSKNSRRLFRTFHLHQKSSQKIQKVGAQFLKSKTTIDLLKAFLSQFHPSQFFLLSLCADPIHMNKEIDGLLRNH